MSRARPPKARSVEGELGRRGGRILTQGGQADEHEDDHRPPGTRHVKRPPRAPIESIAGPVIAVPSEVPRLIEVDIQVRPSVSFAADTDC